MIIGCAPPRPIPSRNASAISSATSVTSGTSASATAVANIAPISSFHSLTRCTIERQRETHDENRGAEAPEDETDRRRRQPELRAVYRHARR